MIQRFVQTVVAENFDELAEIGLIQFEAMVEINMIWLMRNPSAPMGPVEARLAYDPPPLDFRTTIHPTCQVPVLLHRGRGKCDSLAAYEVAGRRLAGQEARIALESHGNGLFHVVSEVLADGFWQKVDVTEMLPKYNGYNACGVAGTEEMCEC